VKTEPTSALEVVDVDFAYGTRQVLFGVSLQVEAGGVTALLGTNGAGKSTLLRVVCGLERCSAGTVRLWGTPIQDVDVEELGSRGVGLLAGGRMTFPGLTVTENLRVGSHHLRRDRGAQRDAVERALQRFPVLAERRNQRAGTLSGGEQQMLALARVLMTSPRLLLIDELSLGLAPRAVEDLLGVVRSVNEDGTTVVLVEQSVNLAVSLADHAVFLERGQVRFDGATTDLLGRDDLLRPVFLTDAVQGD